MHLWLIKLNCILVRLLPWQYFCGLIDSRCIWNADTGAQCSQINVFEKQGSTCCYYWSSATPRALCVSMWLDVLWQKIFDICYCRYSDFGEPGCCFNKEGYPGSWGTLIPVYLLPWLLCCSLTLSLDLAFLNSLCWVTPGSPLVISLSVENGHVC